MKDFGLVSIITPNHNCERFIEQTIESVLAQTYTNWELLIQDDGSTDGSTEIARRYAEQDSRIKLEVNPQNSGAAITRNNAIRRSQGRWLAFLDSDDIWLPEKLERQLTFMAENNCDFSFSRYEHISEEGESLGEQANVIKHLTYNKLMMHCWPGCLTVIYAQDLEHKIYAGDIKKNNDQALFLQVMRHCKRAMGMDKCLALYRIRRGSISRNKWKMIQPYIQVIHEFEGHNILLSYFCLFTQVFIKVFFKYRRITPAESCIPEVQKN